MDDLIIVGLGPAGLTASIYASRYKLKNLLIGETLAGELSKAAKIENLPGFVSISGVEWGEKTKEQVEKLGAEVVSDRVGRIEKLKAQSASWRTKRKTTTQNSKLFGFLVRTEAGEDYQGRTLIVATGSERRKLGIPGEKEYLGRGVSFCTNCDAPFFRDKTVALIGGSDAAVSGAVHAAEFAKKVYIIYRRDKLRAEPIWREEWKKIEQSGKGEVVYKTNITRIIGSQEFAKLKTQNSPASPRRPVLDRTRSGSRGRAKLKTTTQNLKLKEDRVAAVELDRPYKDSKYLLVDGVFIEIGGVPGTSLLKPLGVSLNEAGYVKVNEAMETNLPGLYAAGDITDRSVILVQAITAMAQGAIAAASAYKYLKGEKAPQILGI